MSQQNKLNKIIHFIPITANIGFACLTSLFLLHSFENSAHATNGWDIPLNDTNPAESTISLTLGSEHAQQNLNAGIEGAGANFTYRTAKVNVERSGGYDVYIQAATPELISTEGNKISAVDTATTLNQMPANRWGYSSAIADSIVAPDSHSTIFSAMPADNRTRIGGNSSTRIDQESKTITLSFAAKVDANQPAGVYTNKVIISAVSQPGQVATFSGISTMQELTPTICQAAYVNDTARLRDTRDNNYYWVTKLADGNCWMSQNLALNLTAGTPIEVSNTNGTTEMWTPNVSTYNSVFNTDEILSQPGRNELSYNVNLYISTKPTEVHNCGFDTNNDYTNANILDSPACQEAGFVKVGNSWVNATTTDLGYKASTDPNFYTKNGNKVLNEETKEFDAHYLISHYYQWNAAVAGSDGNDPTVGTLKGDTNAPRSICPAHWQLPSAGSDSYNTSGSFAYMLRQYNLAFSSYSGVSLNTLGDITYNLTLSPFFFVRAGFFGFSQTRQETVGRDMSPLSGTASSVYRPDVSTDNDTTYRYEMLSVGETNDSGLIGVNPSNAYAHRTSASVVRCLVQSQ